MATVPDTTDKLICQCLQVSESEVRTAVDAGVVQCLRTAIAGTGAGSGCTACHRRLENFVRQIQQEHAQSSEPSPIREAR